MELFFYPLIFEYLYKSQFITIRPFNKYSWDPYLKFSCQSSQTRTSGNNLLRVSSFPYPITSWHSDVGAISIIRNSRSYHTHLGFIVSGGKTEKMNSSDETTHVFIRLFTNINGFLKDKGILKWLSAVSGQLILVVYCLGEMRSSRWYII